MLGGMSVRERLQELVRLPGPPGQEKLVREAIAKPLREAGRPAVTDARGNLRTAAADRLPERPKIAVTAHLDEIALQVAGILQDGSLRVAPLGGVHVWKWGERPVEVIAREVALPGVLSLGSIHTTDPRSTVQAVRGGRAPDWPDATVITGFSAQRLVQLGVRPGTRVVLATRERTLWDLAGGLVAAPFLDDRADLVAWERVLAECDDPNVLFLATASEETGGEGAQWALAETRPEVCIALEIGPIVPDASLSLSEQPTVWVGDSYAATSAADLDLIAEAAVEAGLNPRFHLVSRGGSDATIAAANGHCARPITLAFPAENSHGFEIMRLDAIETLARLTTALLKRLR